MRAPNLVFLWAVAVLSLAAACANQEQPSAVTPSLDASGGSVRPGPAMGTDPLPCEVARVLEARCQGCHRQPPLFGAPMPLLTWADTQKQAPSGTGKVWQSMKAKLASGAMPPPSTPTGALTSAEKATLTTWLESGAPAGSACASSADAGAAGDAPPSGPAALPCKPKYEFRASGATAADPFAVPVANDTYQCFSFQVPFTAAEQAIAWAPIIDDARVVHHWILYGHKNTTAPVGCGDTGRVFLVGWAPGGQNGQMPADVGLELPDPGSWLTLEIHYNNRARVTDARDRSGVAMCTTETPRPKEAGVITLGSIGIAIPPESKNFVVTSDIPGTSTRILPEPLHVLWTSPHMHVTGQTFHTDIIRGGQTIPLVDVPHWDFADQRAFPKDPEQTLIQPGDGLHTVCTYDNPTTSAIRFGEKTENEMCFNFVAVYPITGVTLRQWVTNK